MSRPGIEKAGRPVRLLLVAGEVSGDMHAAGLLNAIRERHPGVECFGIGGDALAAAGMEIVRHVREMAAMGLSEVLPKLFFYGRVLDEMTRLARERRPDAVILVDYPDFNLRLAARARKLGLKTIYYICPQVWAWRRSRISVMARTIDRLITIFPFEPGVFAGTGLQVDYVGHPLTDEAANVFRNPPAELPWRGEPRVAMLPGSRTHVIERMLPLFADAARLLKARLGGASFIAAAPSDEIAGVMRRILPGDAREFIDVVGGRTRDILRTASAAMVSSGTATVETAMMRCPMVIAYRMSPVTFFLAKRLVSVERIGMVNIIAGRTLCPEFIQDQATPEAIAGGIGGLLADPAAVGAMQDGFREVAEKLGPPGAHRRAAQLVLQAIGCETPA